jgi:HK97 family phage major capsid protein
MQNVIEMKGERLDHIDEMKALLDTAEREHRNLSVSEKAKYDSLDHKIAVLDQEILSGEKDIERRRKLAEMEAASQRGKGGYTSRGGEPHFANIAEMFSAIAALKRDGQRDERLDTLFEKREQTMGVGATGGYALPEQFDSDVKEVKAASAIVRPRATVIPPGEPPDAKLTFPALDQTAAENMYGGVTVTHTGEGVTMDETTAKLRECSLEPKEISAYIVVTDKLLRNWQQAATFVTRTLSTAMAGTEDLDFISGDGINKALGYINSGASISYARAVANQVAFADAYGMLARALMRDGSSASYVWLASQTIIPQLATMVDAGSHAVWLGGTGVKNAAAGPIPSTLLGFPIIFSDRCPALGSKGDLSLVDLSYYLVKDGSGPFVASSEHVFFTSNKTVFKIVWNVDARPWLTEPIPLEGSTSNTVSPFVVLN